MARYVAEGVDVLVVTCTGGERGVDPQPGAAPTRACSANIAEIRRARDGPRPRDPRRRARTGSASSTPACPRATRCRRCPRAASRLIAARGGGRAAGPAVREFRPHVMTTYDENGGYPHPDHIMRHEIVGRGVRGGRRPGRATPTPASPGSRSSSTTTSASTSRASWRCNDAMRRRGPRVAVRGVARALGGQARGRGPAHDAGACGDYFAVRDAALLAHATQVDPDGAGSPPARHAARGLADRGLPAGPLAGRLDDPRGRPVRGHPHVVDAGHPPAHGPTDGV